MAEYHVGCGVGAIYAGILKPNGIEWGNKSAVTDEAINAAAECENPEMYCTCLKCGTCGRKFDRGFMVDDGGTHIAEEEDCPKCGQALDCEV